MGGLVGLTPSATKSSLLPRRLLIACSDGDEDTDRGVSNEDRCQYAIQVNGPESNRASAL